MLSTTSIAVNSKCQSFNLKTSLAGVQTLQISLQAIDTELGEQLQFSTPAALAPPKVRDPPTLVALLCGGPVAGQQQSLTSAQTYLQQLQTHNPREGFQGDESVPMPNSNGGPETNGAEFSGSETNANDGGLRGQPLQKRKDLTGIHFVPYFITSSLQAMPITAAELHGKSAATLEFESGQNRRELLSLQQLSQQLKAAADVALSTVPSRVGQLAAALAEAGVPCVGSPFEAAQIASHKYRSACLSCPRQVQQPFAHSLTALITSFASFASLTTGACTHIWDHR